MTERGPRRDDEALGALLAAAEPEDARPLGGLIERLAAAGRLRGEVAPGAHGRTVWGIACDSRRVIPGGVFVAVPGAHVDGHAFVARAVAAGAAAVVVEHAVDDAGSAIQIVVDRSRLALAVGAAWWYDDPGRGLGVIGVTGTDGKTTTSAMAVAALEAAGVRTGLVSTAEQKVGRQRAVTSAHVTTPEAPELQRTLRAMVRAGDVAAVVESTSHGLALGRVGEIPYDVAVLTNLTHEHLDFHGTFEAYRAAKRSLFERLAITAGG
ncbi:MAG TPA: Mur ligase family protein, partial [Patescibacteria group bacterium]|nr:Mur ligase family protein [Patescibacteria group bacterium]